MKSIKSIFIVAFVCVFLCSCFDEFPYRGERPKDYPNSYWVCEQYDVWFFINKDKQLEKGRIKINDEEIPFAFKWTAVNNKVSIQFEFNSQIECIIGYCEFGENEFSIKIDDTEGFYPKEQIVMEFERRSIKEYYATHA